ncbi:ABC transporter permease [Oleiagrimonas sp.]|jgi:lipopolysaccharide transport system permease protein|uniref:ABC transporter permease n=1 Tax=Oleiagrimonas sp. TaxID=2010330 RepID=UPI002625CEB4|nr:ABC transporter permease [Oleiagrimonas sp.]MDA3913405.1 ABC transporter permease [Oleiagrimonas sp.]
MTTTFYRLVNPAAPYVALKRHFALIVQMAKRDVISRYRGSFAGLLWSFFNPLLMLAIYTFVFGYIFKARWNAQMSGHPQFAIILFAGLNINQFFSECANKAPSLIIQNSNFVKKIVFPLESLAWSTVGAALFHLLVSTVVLLVISILVNHTMPWTVVLFPLVVVCFTPFVAGTVWLLASLGVFLRDLQQAMAVITTALMFLAPILYPITNIPERFRILVYMNPLTEMAIASQKTLVMGEVPNWMHLGVYVLISGLFSWLAFIWFERTRKGFADVI